MVFYLGGNQSQLRGEQPMKRNKKMDNFILIGLTICSIGVVVFTVIQQFRQRNEVLADKKEQLKQKDEIISEFKNLITGGDSFLFLRPSKVINTDEVLFLIEFKGKYPLYDTTILIEEFDLIKISGNDYNFRKANQRTISLGTVNPLRANNLFQITIPQPSGPGDQFGKHYFFKISSRNGLVEEDVYISREGTQFSMAYKVVYFEPDYSGQFGGIGIGAIKRKIRHIDFTFPVHQLDHIEGDSGWKADYENQTGAKIVQE